MIGTHPETRFISREEHLFSPFPGLVAPHLSSSETEWTWGRVMLAASLATLSLITVLGNSLILVAIATSRAQRAMPFSIFLANMATTDLLVGAVLDSLWGIFSVYGMLEMDDGPVCVLYLGFEYMISFVTPAGLLAIAADRAWAARWPAHHLRHGTRARAAAFVAAAWLYAALIWFPAFAWDRLGHAYVPGDCYMDHGCQPALTYALASLGYLLPAALALLCYGVMAYSMLARRRRADAEEARHQRERLASLPNSGGLVVLGLALYVRERHGAEYQLPDDVSEASEISAAGDIPDPAFFAEFDDSELPEARLEHHLERRALYLLTAKLAVYLCSWTPYFVTFLSSADERVQLPQRFVVFSVWCTYINAAVNPLLTILSGEHVSVHIENMAERACRAVQRRLRWATAVGVGEGGGQQRDAEARTESWVEKHSGEGEVKAGNVEGRTEWS